MVVTGERKKKRSVFTGHIEKEQQAYVAVDVFIYVFVNEAPTRESREREEKRNVLNNTTNYAATFFPCCRENRFEYLLFTQTSC